MLPSSCAFGEPHPHSDHIVLYSLLENHEGHFLLAPIFLGDYPVVLIKILSDI